MQCLHQAAQISALGLSLHSHPQLGVTPASQVPWPRQTRVWLRPGAVCCSTHNPSSPRPPHATRAARLVTFHDCDRPRLEVPAPRPLLTAVDLPLTRALEDCSETAVSEWFEESAVSASFNLEGMTTKGQPAELQRGRVWRSCRRAGPGTRPALGPRHPSPCRPPRCRPRASPHPHVGVGARRGQRARALGGERARPRPRPAPSHVLLSVHPGMCGRM